MALSSVTVLDQLTTVPAVESIMADFEVAAWQALRQVLSDMKLSGNCAFYFT